MQGDRDCSFLPVLPSDWDRDRLKDVVDLRREKLVVQDQSQNYLELEDIESGTGRILSRRDTLDVDSAVTRFEPGDVLFGKLRPYLEKYGQPDFRGYCTGEILALAPRRINGRFLYYCMGAHWLIQRCNALAYGAKMPRVNWPKQLSVFDLPLPLALEQERIAAYLDASCLAIDQALSSKRAQITALGDLRSSATQAAVSRGLNAGAEKKATGISWLGRIPSHWSVKKLKRVLRCMDYGTSESTTTDGDFAVLKMGNVVDGEICFSKMEFLPDVSSHLILETGDLLFNRTNSLDQVAKVGIFRGDAADKITFASYLVRLRTDGNNDPGYFCYLLNSGALLGLARSLAIPSVQQANLNPTRYGRLEVPVPPLAEQRQIREYLDGIWTRINKIEHMLEEQVGILVAYRKSLVHECVTGIRRISDSDVAKAEANV